MTLPFGSVTITSVDAQERLKSLEFEKERQIREYLSLQDKADSVNESIYKVCCHIEELNQKIQSAREEVLKADAGPGRKKACPS